MSERLADILARQNPGFTTAVETCGYLNLWPEVVEERISSQTEPVKIVSQTLYVNTSSPVWAQELTFLKAGIIDKFNRKAGRQVITDIRFRGL